ncbi:perlucin-like [Mytilus trossulus]|uniref:perlucin-like n=1 Tax=Mytilus trossulus TaxID=6551 RepID=UPI003003F821
MQNITPLHPGLSYSFCRSYHSQLADVQTRQENTFLVDTIDNIERYTGTVRHYWLDGTDEVLEGVWVWASTGKQLSYTNWYPTEPNNQNGKENCLEIKSHRANGWNDIDCSHELNFICEMEYPAGGSIIGK